jgi:hypothetical protein
MKKLWTMKNLIVIMAIAVTTASASAQLSAYERHIAEKVGISNAGIINSMGSRHGEIFGSARDMAKQQASMFGVNTKEDLLEFIDIAEKATKAQLEILKEVK